MLRHCGAEKHTLKKQGGSREGSGREGKRKEADTPSERLKEMETPDCANVENNCHVKWLPVLSTSTRKGGILMSIFR